MDIFAMRLKKVREHLKRNDPKWTQSYVAEKIGVARTSYTSYESGAKQPPLETVNKLADLFNVDINYLIGRTDTPITDSESHKVSVSGTEFVLSPEEYRIFEEIKKHPVMFHDLAKDPEKKIKKLIKMWELIRDDIEEE